MKTLIISPPNLAINQNAYRQTDCAVALLGGLFIEYYKNTSLELLSGYDDDGNFHIEEFRDIIGYERIYQISSFGRVKSLGRKLPNNHIVLDKILKPKFDKYGYLVIGLCGVIKQKWVKIHRLVGVHFIENENNKPLINHKKGIKTDNRFFELEWCTVRENNIHYHLSQEKTSIYTGVYRNSADTKWCSHISKDKINYHLGTFESEITAYQAYKQKEKELYG